MVGTNVGFAMANDFDKKGHYRGKVKRRWDAIRNKALRDRAPSNALTGKALDNAVLALAATDPSLVKFEQAGA